MDFEIIGELSDVETIAVGSGVRVRARPRRRYGGSRWRKLKGVASVRLSDGEVRLAEVRWYEAYCVGERVQAEVAVSQRTMSEESQTARFAVCLDNDGYEASLDVGKLYRVMPDGEAAAHGYVRVVDESGEDYAFRASRFHYVDLPREVERALLEASHP